ncbi:MAG: hypothetical protein ACI9U2_004560 [Bradymonadia bacterium]
MKNVLIALFLALQIGLPLSYYLGDEPHDERFAWRMFSPIRLIKCDVTLYDASGGARARIRPLQEMHVVWRNLMRRGRIPVVEAFARTWCAAAPDRKLMVDLTCGPPDGRLLGICRRGPGDRNNDGVPDGYADPFVCAAGDLKACFANDCGDKSAAACHAERCVVRLVPAERDFCAEGG